MPNWYVTVEATPGDHRSEEYFDVKDCDEQTAWDYARSRARRYGPSARVKSVKLIGANGLTE